MTDLVALYREASEACHKAKRALTRLRDNGKQRGIAVEVVRGRKVAVGTVGVLEAWGENQYGDWCKVRIGHDSVFIAARNVTFPELYAAITDAASVCSAADDARRAIADAVVADAGVNLAKPVERGQTVLNAYSDDWSAVYACNPEASDAVVKLAVELLDPPESSWGKLRYSHGSRVESRSGDRVTVRSSVGLCD